MRSLLKVVLSIILPALSLFAVQVLPTWALEGREGTEGSHCVSQSASYSVSSSYDGYEKKDSLLTGSEDLLLARLPNTQDMAPEFSFHTDLEERPYIVIDLGRECLIDGLVVENRRRQLLERASGLLALVSSDKTHWRLVKAFDTVAPMWSLNLSVPERARYVKLQLSGRNYFHLAHVFIQGRELNDSLESKTASKKSTAVPPEQTTADLDRSAAGDRPIRDKWAVVIGVNEFDDERIPRLQYAAKDASDFADFLVNSGNFAKDHVILLTNENATEHEIKRVIGDDWLPRRVMEDDVVVIYASTHGSPKEMDVAGENFLVVHDTNVDSLFSSGIELEDLARTIKRRTQCDRVVIILDACNSGAAVTKGPKGLIRTANFDLSSIAGEGTIVISSSGAGERSWESKRYKNGVFTHGLMEALKSKGVQTGLSDAFSVLKDNVEQEVRFDRKTDQTPVMKMNWNGKELAILAPPTKPRTTEPYIPTGTGQFSQH